MTATILGRAAPAALASSGAAEYGHEMGAEGRPKIVLVSNYPVDHATFTGGVETAVAALLQGLRAYQDEFEFHIVALSRSIAEDRREVRDGFEFHFLGLSSVEWLPFRFPIRIAKVYREVRRIGPRVVHCQANLVPAIGLVLAPYPRVFTLHGVASSEARFRTGEIRFSSLVWKAIERFVVPRFDAIICISGYAAEFIGPRQARFAIPNAVDSRFLQAQRARRNGTHPSLLFVGQIAPLKRPLDLVLAHEALRREFPDLETLLCGPVDDPEYDRLLRRTISERATSGIRLLGPVSRTRLLELLLVASVLVLPSAQENAPMAIAEAMAAGVPVVASRVGGVADMVVDGATGFLYEAGDVPALIGAIRTLLGDSYRRDAIGHQARSLAQSRYAPERVAEATVDVYRHLLHQSSHGPASAQEWTGRGAAR